MPVNVCTCTRVYQSEKSICILPSHLKKRSAFLHIIISYTVLYIQLVYIVD